MSCTADLFPENSGPHGLRDDARAGSVLLQISDTHFGTAQPAVVRALVVLSKKLQPDLVVLSGDITQRARPEQFREAKAFVDRLAAPTIAIPGNHDIPLFELWERFRRPYARYAEAFGANLEPVFTSDDLLVVGVNTTRPWRHKHGEVSNAQVDRVARLLGGASSRQLCLVVVHQPVAVTRAKDRINLLRGHESAMRVWSAAGADIVLGGHIHLPYVKAVQPQNRTTWVVQAGTAVSSRTRPSAPNSVNVLRWPVFPGRHASSSETQRDGRCSCLVERWDYSVSGDSFVCATSTLIQPDGN